MLAHNRDFRRIWAGESVSAIGSQLTLLALPLVAVSQLAATPVQMGLLGAAQTLPFLLFAVLAGVWVDRCRKRPILIGANLAKGLILGLVPLLAVCRTPRHESVADDRVRRRCLHGAHRGRAPVLRAGAARPR